MIKLNDVEVVPTIFPDGTSQVWKLDEDLLASIERDNEADVTWEFSSESEYVHLAQLRTLLFIYTDNVHLFLPYLPYARQDKHVSNETTFAFRVFSRMLNLLDFNTVEVLDPHCKTRVHMIDNVTSLSPRSHIQDAISATSAGILLFPDQGALRRYEPLQLLDHVVADKVRDQATGTITSFTLNGSVLEHVVLIVDDLCDGGYTFVLAAKAAYASGATEVHLYTTHGLYTKGLQVLRDAGIRRIFNCKGEVK